MALKASKLKQIPQRNKDLAFGYLRERENKTKCNYPQLMKYLILLYSNAQDQFDSNATHECLKIIGNRIIDEREKIASFYDYLSYLENKVNEGIHVWNFKYRQENGTQFFSQIGIWKTRAGKPVIERVYIHNTNKDNVNSGYMISMDGMMTNPQNVGANDPITTNVSDGSIIEMKLDLYELSLTLKINDKIIKQFDNIEQTSYRAAISTVKTGEGFILLSYQDIYK